jgi:hypothetical protein
MKTEHISEQDVCLYVDALKLRKTDLLPEDIVAHVADCAACKQEVMQLYDTLQDVEYTDAESHPYFGLTGKPERRSLPLFYRIAAAIVLMLGAGFMAYYAFVKQPATQEAPTTQSAVVDTVNQNLKHDSQTTATVRKDFAANYTPSPNLENLVDDNFRASSITVEFPRNGQSVAGKITFRWMSQSEASYKLRIVTNKEKEIYQATTNRGTVLYDKPLEPGLYYWMLLGDGELVHVGKFKVPLP